MLSLEKLIQSSVLTSVLSPRNLFLETAFPWLIALAQKEQSLMVNMALVNTLSGIWRQELRQQVPDAIRKTLENMEGSYELLRKIVELVGQNRLHPLDSEHWLPHWAQEKLPMLLWDGDPNVRAGSLILLDPRQKREHIEVIIHRLWEDVNVVRAKAAEALGRLGDLRAVELLIVALPDMDVGVRTKVAEALGRLGDPRAVEPLIVALRGPGDKEVRAKAAEALGRLGDPRAVEPLIVALRGPGDKEVRAKAAEALGRLGDPRAVEPLIVALRDPADKEVRAKAAEALGRLGDLRAVEPLTEAMADQEISVWMAATIALNLPPLSLFRQLQSG